MLPLYDVNTLSSRKPPESEAELIFQQTERDFRSHQLLAMVRARPTLLVLPKWRSGMRLTRLAHPVLLDGVEELSQLRQQIPAGSGALAPVDRFRERIAYTASDGRELLSDSLPTSVDPRVAARLKPIIGDVSAVRVHTGKTASEAARAMNARAFAIGDQDVFLDEAEMSPSSTEGRALLAHELAHTRDVATGFALSRQSGLTGSDGEAFAHAVESSYVQAEADEETAPTAARSRSGNAGAEAATTSDPMENIDRQDLERRIWDIIKAQEKRSGDRYGR